MNATIPAPWKLEGQGYILLYKFKKTFLRERGFIPEGVRDALSGGIGAVMLVDYTESEVGPYDELLFIPGKFRLGGGRWDRITKIYVSTMVSVLNGRLNWAIPKERADFKFTRENGKEEISVTINEQSIFHIILESKGPRFPVDTRFLPFPLLQGDEGSFLQTTFSGSGMGRFASVKKIEIDQSFFPDVSHVPPLAVIAVNPFRLTFPVARHLP